MDKPPWKRDTEANNSPRSDPPGKPCRGGAFTTPRRASCEGAYEFEVGTNRSKPDRTNRLRVGHPRGKAVHSTVPAGMEISASFAGRCVEGRPGLVGKRL